MFDISCCLILSLLPEGAAVLVSALTASSWVEEAVEPVRAEISEQSERRESSQPQLTLNLFLDGDDYDANALNGCLHGGHLSCEQGLLSGGAGPRIARDLLGVGGDLGTLGEVFCDLDD